MRARPLLSVALAVSVAWSALAAGRGLGVAIAGTPAVALAAGDEAAADAAIRRGVDLRKQGKDQDALEEFRKAYAVAKTPRALAQIGLAEQALGRWVDAESDLDQAMGSKGDPWIRKNAATLNGALDVIRRHLGSLEVIGPEGAELRVDGRVVGTLPLSKPARLPIGNLTVELRRSGFFPATRPVSISAGELTRESMDMQSVAASAPLPAAAQPREAAPSPIRALPGDGAGDRVATGPDGSLRSRSDSGGGQPVDGGARPRAWQRPLAWTVAAGALLGGLAGGTALWIRSGAISDANKLTCNVDEAHMTVMPPDKANGPRCEQFASKGAHAKTAALISFSAAGALAIAAVVLFATAPSTASASSSPATARSSLACAPSLAATGVACQLRF